MRKIYLEAKISFMVNMDEGTDLDSALDDIEFIVESTDDCVGVECVSLEGIKITDAK